MDSLVSFSLGKGLLVVTYVLWGLFWSGNKHCDSGFTYILIITFSLLSTIGIGAIMSRLQPRRISAQLLHNYMIICVFSLFEYLCLCVSQAFYVGSDIILGCNNTEESHPLILSALFLGFGILALLVEIYYGIDLLQRIILLRCSNRFFERRRVDRG